MTLQLIQSGTHLTATGDPEIICDNADYTAEITTELTDPVLHLTAEQDGENTEYELPLTDGETDLPTIRNAFGVWAWLSGAELTTERVWLPCHESIKAGRSGAYSAPYDVYNAAVEYANAARSGAAGEEELEAMLAALQDRYEHPPAWPGTAYKRAIAATVRETKITGKLTLKNGTEIPIDDNSIAESTLAISTTAVADDYLLPGGVPSRELSATLRGDLPQEQLRGAEIEPTFRLRLESGVWQDIPLGAFTIMQASDDTTRGVPVTAYDDMRKLDLITPTDCGFAAQTGYSPNQIIAKICAAAGVDYTQNIDFDDNFVNVNSHSYVCAALGVPSAWGWAVAIANADEIGDIQAALDEMYHGLLTYRGSVDYPNQLTKDGVQIFDAFLVRYGGPVYIAADIGAVVETGRDMLMHTLFTVGGCAEIDSRSRELTVKPITAAHDAEEIGENRTTRRAVSRLPYRLYSLTMPIDYIDADDRNVYTVVRKEETMWPVTDVAAETTANALWTTLDADPQYNGIDIQIHGLVDGLLDPVTYHPGRLDLMRGDPTIGLLDWTTTDGERMMPITGIVWRYRGQQQLTACGSDAVAKATTSQLEKGILGGKVEASKNTRNVMRNIYGQLMQSYRGMQNFKYRDIEHYTYNQLGGGEIT